MKKLLLATVCAMGCAGTGAQAQMLTISTSNPGGLANSIGTAIAKVVTDAGGIRTVTVPNGGAIMQPVASGEADCGVNTAFDVSFFANGTEFYSASPPNPNLRLVGSMLPSLIAMYARADSGIVNVADLKGRNVPGRMDSQPAIGLVYDTYLELAGLSRDDVNTVPTQSTTQSGDDLVAGRNDAFAFALGGAKTMEVDSSVGGIRVLTVPGGDEAKALVDSKMPGAILVEVQPSERWPQVREPANVISYNLVLFCADTVPEETIYKITKALYENKALLQQSFASMAQFDQTAFASPVPGLEFHPGAQKFFEEAGVSVPAN